MAYEDPREAEREKHEDKRKSRQSDQARDEERWDSLDDADYRYTDWASI